MTEGRAINEQENFTGCQAISYCLMDNHFHLLLEVPPMVEGGLADEELLNRLSAIYGEAFVACVAKELVDARTEDYTSDSGMDEAFAGARDRFGPKRKDGARRMKGEGAAAKGALWSLRDLRKGIA